jgi:hypothetical protein
MILPKSTWSMRFGSSLSWVSLHHCMDDRSRACSF